MLGQLVFRLTESHFHLFYSMLIIIIYFVLFLIILKFFLHVFDLHQQVLFVGNFLFEFAVVLFHKKVLVFEALDELLKAGYVLCDLLLDFFNIVQVRLYIRSSLFDFLFLILFQHIPIIFILLKFLLSLIELFLLNLI